MPPIDRAGIAWCLCARQAVFLDLARDRYFCLPEALDLSFRRWAAGEAPTPADLARLVACGVAEPDAREPVAATSHAAPTLDLATDLPRRQTVRDIAAAVVLQLGARRALARSPLSTIISGIEARRLVMTANDRDEARLRRVAGAFAASAAILRAHDQCLPRAIAARRLCDRLDQAAALVFGVRLSPFAAHCWVQSGDAVVTGDLEVVRLYTPILVVA
ncbi:lasso peptide biosynthesis B2 protein [Sphingomonas mali]|uniref:lasso peptide biosynthesis B2 protein n=1 Tax=Sphingomonas mali TaxID=40682 RepID=UPI000834CF3C|nr:lasso peptide biosynthesis B2 protein [Sphingomonas mali]